jgi:DNA-binding GntR family transcriptional regulator
MDPELGTFSVDAYASKQKVIAQALQNDILTGRLGPGTLLRQEELAERFEVSPTPVREALRELGARGLVVHELHRGVRVADIRTDTLEEIRQVRALLEPYATELATPLLGEDEIAELEEVNQTIGDSDTSQEEIRVLNRKFHMQIYEAASSGHLMSLINLTWSAYPWMSLMLPRSDVPAAMAQHQEILDAIAADDGQKASDLMRDHIRGTLVQPVSVRE